MIQIWIELLDPSSSLDRTLKRMVEFAVMCCACCCLQRWVPYPLLNVSLSPSSRTILSASLRPAQSILPVLCFVVRLRLQTIFNAAGTWTVPIKHQRSPFNTRCPLIFPPSVITNTDECRHFKELTKTSTRLEENMFHMEDDAPGPKVYLRPKESVLIPLKYQSFLCDHTLALQVLQLFDNQTLLSKSYKTYMYL